MNDRRRIPGGHRGSRWNGRAGISVSAGTDSGIWTSGAQTLAGVAATGGTAPYTYRWSVISGGGTFSDNTSLTSTFSPTTIGTHRLELVATDSQGMTGASTVNIVCSTPWQLLGAYLREYWVSDAGISLVSGNVDTWTGQILGIVLSAAGASNRPTYGADSTYFNGASVVQCSETGPKYLACGDYGADLLTAGTYPWGFAVTRCRTAPAANGYIWAVNAAAHQVLFGGMHTTAGADRSWFRTGTGSNHSVDGDTVSPAPSMIESWGTDSVAVKVRSNYGSASSTVGTAFGLTNDLAARRVAVGAHGLGGEPSNSSIRCVAFCTSKPPEAMIASVYTYFQDDSDL